MPASTTESESPAFKSFSKGERIRQLNEIDKAIVQLLQSAGLALQTLTSSREESPPSYRQRRDAFESSSNSYFQTLQVVDVGLRRQIVGLEEANITFVDKAREKVKDNNESQDQLLPGKAPVQEKTYEGGLGKLDIGWLNSMSGVVARDMEAELWQKAGAFLEEHGENGQMEGSHDEQDKEMTG